MLAQPGLLPGGDEWHFELKWNGIRALAYIADRRCRLFTGNHREVTGRFPELQAIATRLPTAAQPAVIDGEIVLADGHGGRDVSWLQQRIALKDPIDLGQDGRENSAFFATFDLIVRNGQSIAAHAYEDRHFILTETMPSVGPWTVPDVYTDGQRLLNEAVARGFDGIVAKRLGSMYEAGRRSQNWTTVQPRRCQSFVVGGWLSDSDMRGGEPSSLLVGCFMPDTGRLSYRGQVRVDPDDETLGALASDLGTARSRKRPFAVEPPTAPDGDVRYVKPRIVVEVEYEDLTNDRRLHRPVLRGLRHDKDPHEVVFR